MNPLLCCLEYLYYIYIYCGYRKHALYTLQPQQASFPVLFVYFVCCVVSSLTLDAFIKRMASSKSSRSTRWENRARAWAWKNIERMESTHIGYHDVPVFFGWSGEKGMELGDTGYIYLM